MKGNKSSYSCMYLVPKEIYEKLLNLIDEKDNRQLHKLNPVGNEEGAFPNLLPDPFVGPGRPGPGDDDSDNYRPNNSPEQPLPSRDISDDGSLGVPGAFNYQSSTPHNSDVSMASVRSDEDAQDRVGVNVPTTSNVSKKFKHVCEMCWASFQNRKDYDAHKRDHYRQEGDSIIRGHMGPPSTGILRPDINLGKLRATQYTIPGTVPPDIISHNTDSVDRPPLKNNLADKMDYFDIDADDESSSEGLKSLRKNPKCQLCTKQFLNSKLLKKHLYYCGGRSKARKNTRTVKTLYSRPAKSTLKVAARQVLQTKKSSPDPHSIQPSLATFQCIFCPFSFSTKNSLDRHTIRAHEIDKQGVSLYPQGEKRNVNKAGLKEPRPSKVLKIQPYQCSICGQSMKSKFQLKAHTDNKHKKIKQGDLFTCNFCNTIFSSEKSLVRHLANIHECDKNYKSLTPQGVKRTKTHLTCPECDKKFSMLFNLQKHVEKEHANKKYSSWA